MARRTEPVLYAGPIIETRFVGSSVGTHIALDRTGGGRPLVLLRGGLVHDRRSWRTRGYIHRLRERLFLLAIGPRRARA